MPLRKPRDRQKHAHRDQDAPQAAVLFPGVNGLSQSGPDWRSFPRPPSQLVFKQRTQSVSSSPAWIEKPQSGQRKNREPKYRSRRQISWPQMGQRELRSSRITMIAAQPRPMARKENESRSSYSVRHMTVTAASTSCAMPRIFQDRAFWANASLENPEQPLRSSKSRFNRKTSVELRKLIPPYPPAPPAALWPPPAGRRAHRFPRPVRRSPGPPCPGRPP